MKKLLAALTLAVLMAPVIRAQTDSTNVQVERKEARNLSVIPGKWVVGLETGSITGLPGKLSLFRRLGPSYHMGLSVYGFYSNPEPRKESYDDWAYTTDTKRYEYRATINNLVYFKRTNHLMFNFNLKLTGSRRYDLNTYLYEYTNSNYNGYERLERTDSYQLMLPIGVEYPFVVKGRRCSAGLTLTAGTIDGYKRNCQYTYSNPDTNYTRRYEDKNTAQLTLGPGPYSYLQLILKYWF